MRPGLAAAAALLLASSLAQAHVTRPLGRAAKAQRGERASPLWEDREGAFALARPDGGRWAFRSGVEGPDGKPVPLLARSQESGAQVVVQSTDVVGDLRRLARMLSENLANEDRVHVEEIEEVLARGGEAYAFGFSVADQVRGRVAVVRTGAHVALVIASWPFGASVDVSDDIAAMIGSLGPIGER